MFGLRSQEFSKLFPDGFRSDSMGSTLSWMAIGDHASPFW
jgi:hypothetical protein